MKLTQKIEEYKNYKWAIIAAAFVMVFTCLGFCSGTKGLYLDAITAPEALNIPRRLFTINDSCRYITTSIVNLFFGVLVYKFGARKMVAAGFLSLIGSMLVYSVAESLYQFYIGGILLGMGLSWTTTTMVGYIVECWCKEHKGTIMGAVLAANGLGGALATQIISPIIHDDANPFGYRSAYRLTALLVLIVGIVVVLIFRDKPASERPGAKREKKAKGESWTGISFAEAIRKPYFYAVAICVFFTGMSLQSVSGCSSAHLRDIGFEDSYVDIVMSVHALALAAFKFLAGISYDRIGLKKTLYICNISAVIMILLLAIVQVGTAGSVIAMVYGVLSSAALPLETIILPLIASDMFGKKDYSKILGIMVSVNTAGYAIGVPVANACYDAFKTYSPALYVTSGIMIAVLIAYQFIFRAADKQRQAVLAREQIESVEK